MAFDFDPNLGRTIIGHIYQIRGRDFTARVADSMLDKIIDDSWRERWSGKKPDVDLNIAYMQVRAELAKMDGNRKEATRLEGWARAIERGR